MGATFPDVSEAVAEHPTVELQVVVQEDPTQAVLQLLKVEVSHLLLEPSLPFPQRSPIAPKCRQYLEGRTGKAHGRRDDGGSRVLNEHGFT